MERLYHTCGPAILYAAREDGTEYFPDFRHAERLYQIHICPQCGAPLEAALANGQLTEQAPALSLTEGGCNARHN